MKVPRIVLLGLLAAGAAAGAAQAQTTSSLVLSDPPGVMVAEIRWQQAVFIPALYDDPMRINQDQRDLERDQKNTSTVNSDRARRGETPIPSPNRKIAANLPVGSTPMGVPLGDEPAGNRNLPSQKQTEASSVYYLYKARIKNTGVKTIRNVIWHFVLLDTGTGVEVGRHRFNGKVSIRSGKSVEIVGRSRTPPTRTVNAGQSTGELRAKHTEQVVIERIDYADGTVWERPSN